MNLDPEIFTRFWSKVAVALPHECWNYKAGLDPDGYGIFAGPDGSIRAHRLAYRFAHGRFAEPMTLHTCNNRRCCNPSHLYEWTALANSNDCMASGNYRTVYVEGERHRNSKMTDDQLNAALQKMALGHKQAWVARELGVTPSAISYHRKKKGLL